MWADGNLGYVQSVERSFSCCEPHSAFQGLASQKTCEDWFFYHCFLLSQGRWAQRGMRWVSVILSPDWDSLADCMHLVGRYTHIHWERRQRKIPPIPFLSSRQRTIVPKAGIPGLYDSTYTSKQNRTQSLSYDCPHVLWQGFGFSLLPFSQTIHNSMHGTVCSKQTGSWGCLLSGKKKEGFKLNHATLSSRFRRGQWPILFTTINLPYNSKTIHLPCDKSHTILCSMVHEHCQVIPSFRATVLELYLSELIYVLKNIQMQL